MQHIKDQRSYREIAELIHVSTIILHAAMIYFYLTMRYIPSFSRHDWLESWHLGEDKVACLVKHLHHLREE